MQKCTEFFPYNGLLFRMGVLNETLSLSDEIWKRRQSIGNLFRKIRETFFIENTKSAKIKQKATKRRNKDKQNQRRTTKNFGAKKSNK